jgi:hypothetical protein
VDIAVQDRLHVLGVVEPDHGVGTLLKKILVSLIKEIHSSIKLQKVGMK